MNRTLQWHIPRRGFSSNVSRSNWNLKAILLSDLSSTRAVEKILFAQLQLAKLAKSKLIRFNAEHWVRPVLVPFVGLMDTVRY